jgi:diguanylate cyclase (GGDEF)-like protein
VREGDFAVRFDEQTLRQILGAMQKVAVFVVDDRMQHRLCGGDPQVLADTGFEPPVVEGRTLGYSLDTSDVWRTNVEAMFAAVEQGKPSEGIETVWRSRYYESSAAPIREGGEIVGAVLLVRDVSHRKRNDLQLEAFARTDHLTGLANKNRFQIVLRRMTRGAAPLAVVLLDLDGFKRLNDTKGHSEGDTCLRGVARVLENSTRGTDTVARIGGDEFAVLLTQFTDRAAVDMVAGRMRAGIEAMPFGVSASLGVAIFPDDSADPDALLRTADERMFVDKRERKAAR